MTLTAWVTKVPVCVAAASAVVYFGASAGIRQHVLLLWRAARVVADHLR